MLLKLMVLGVALIAGTLLSGACLGAGRIVITNNWS